jgi:hypothetical protein
MLAFYRKGQSSDALLVPEVPYVEPQLLCEVVGRVI